MMKKMKKGGKKLTLEQYLQFCQFSFGSYISRSNLNQIIELHGFMKLHQERKSHIKECMESIDLTKPMRSTLDDDSISSRAFLTADEISADLKSMGWRECRLIRSVETLTSDATSADESPCRHRRGIQPAEFLIVGKRPRSKRKSVSVNKLISALSSVSSSSFVVVDHNDDAEDSVPQPPLSLPPGITLPPPRFFGPPPGITFPPPGFFGPPPRIPLPPPGFFGPLPGFGDAFHWKRY